MYRLKLLSLIILSFVLCLPLSANAVNFSPVNIRIAVLKGVETVRLEGSGLTVTDDQGKRLDISSPAMVKRSGNGISVNGISMRRLLASCSSGTPNVVLVNGKGYRNGVEIQVAEKGLVVINELGLEDYLAGIINCEISSQWSMEAVKAQAVVARSYAVFQREARKNLPYHLESTVLDQVYGGCDLEDSRAVRGVRETAGEMLMYDGKVIQAFFHSSCGGHTEAAENVWSFGMPYLRGVDCKYCLTSPSVEWVLTIPLDKLESILRNGGYAVAGLRGIIPLSRNKSGRIESLSIVFENGSVNLSAVDFRKMVGYSVIKSTNFDVRISGENAIFSGRGYGHGVGLCQWGAKKRAEDGFNYREILSYYYPGTTLKKIY
jgi:stage II sporulation protein D